MATLIAITIALSFLVSLLLVPVVRGIAHRVGMVDVPDRGSKMHRKSVALGGGVAVFASVLVTFAAVLWYDQNQGGVLLGTIEKRWFSLFFAVAAMLCVGLIDDFWELRGRQKLLLQITIISALVGSGTLVEKIGLFGRDIELGAYAYPITLLWLLIAVNALNLIDGADGMATTAGCIISAGLALMSLQHDTLCGLVALALAGGLMGFLVFNKPPASIFLGDAGSMMIGLFVGVLACWSSVKGPTVLASAPVAILAIPLFDSSAAVVRRWLTGRSIYATDRGHLHHLLQEKFGPTGMLLMVAGLCLFTTLLSVISVPLQAPWLAGLGVLGVLTALVCTRSFGHAECRLILGKTINMAQSFLVAPHKSIETKQQTVVPLQGSGNWDTVWEPLVELAKSHRLAKIKIDLSLAWLHEGYHATWTSIRLPEKAAQMVVRTPLFTTRSADGQLVSIGRLEIIGPADDPTVYQRISDLCETLVDLGPQIDAIIEELELKQPSPAIPNYVAPIRPEHDEPVSTAGSR